MTFKKLSATYPYEVTNSGFMSHSTQNRSFQRIYYSQPISRLRTEETKLNITKASNTGIKWSKLKQNTENAKPKQTQ